MENTEHIIAIRRRSTQEALEAFKAFMQLLEVEINERTQSDPKSIRQLSPFELEYYTLALLKELAPQTPFRASEISLNKAQHFPDIISERYYGLEVKSTKEDHWTSTGSSIIESTRTPSVEQIYLLFGKLGGVPSFRCRPYEDCMVNIAVTHAPRYLINMGLKPSETIFAKMGLSYDELRTNARSIDCVRNYYRKEALKQNKLEMPWWIGRDLEEGATGMTVRLWADLSREERKALRIQLFVLFPEVLLSDYRTAALWLCTRHAVLVHNARDSFSAGGAYTKLDGIELGYKVPHIFGELLELSSDIKAFLDNIPETFERELAMYRPELAGKSNLHIRFIDNLCTFFHAQAQARPQAYWIACEQWLREGKRLSK